MEKNCILKRYIEYILLFILIVVLFSIVSYTSLNNTNIKSKIIVNDISTKLDYEVKYKYNETYLNILDYNKVLKDSIFLDKISQKLIFTTKVNRSNKRKCK